MTILCWNCQGLGDPRTVQELTRLVHAHQPKLLFLSETRQNKFVVEGLRWRLGLKHVVSFHEPGKGGGLALFWHEDVKVELFKIGSRVIDVIVHEWPKNNKWRCTFVYGEPRTHLRHHMWTLLKRIKPMLDAPWLMARDFNEALYQNEHFSETKRGERQMMDFREILSHCDLHDLGFSGTPWTYDNKQSGRRNVKVRLDRAVACPAWSNIFPNCQVRHLVSSRSDHTPLLISLTQKSSGSSSGRRCCRYEIFWEKEKTLADEVEVAWTMHRQATNLGDVTSKLEGVMDALHLWSNKTVGSVPRKIEKTRKELEAIIHSNNPNKQAIQKRLEKELDSLLEKEELFWK